MAGKQQKSKKLSAANSKQHNKIVIYLDRNLGSIVIPAKLRAAGAQVEIHDDHLPQAAPDEDWINLVGQHGWVAITKDRNIQHRIAEHIAIIEAKAKILVVRAKDVTGDQCADILIKYLTRIENYANHNQPPFLAGIDRNGNLKAYNLKTY